MFERWNKPNGYRDVLRISLPLVASTASTTVMIFTDRIFLGNYSMDALAAATPAGLMGFTFLAFFLGVAGYANTFIAQYTGSGEKERVGASLWQAIYFSLFASLVMTSLYFIAVPLFDWAGHDPAVRPLEVSYFRVLVLGGGSVVLHNSLSCFYSGRGLTKTIMVVHIIGAGINVPLDYVLINGVWIFPELGITGAGIATVISSVVVLVLFAILVFTRKNDAEFRVWRSRHFDAGLFGRLMRFGLPSGVQFFVDLFAFSLFLFFVGRLGKVELAATNAAFALNTLAFLPMIGFAIGTSTLVGQAIGRRRPEDGVEVTFSGLHITFIYMALVTVLYLAVPEELYGLFEPRRQPGWTDAQYADRLNQFGEATALGVVLLRFVAAYCLFDTGNLIFAAAVKGAGDTKFVMWTVSLMSTFLMVVPVWCAIELLGAGLFAAWSLMTVYVCLLALVFWWRFSQGKWKSMSVIEAPSRPVLSQAGVPGADEVL